MAKPDYKQSPRPEKHPTSPIMPFMSGLLSGVFLSFLGYLYVSQETLSSAHHLSQATVSTAKIQAPAPQKPKPLDQTTFEFYTILAEQEERIEAIDHTATQQSPPKPKIVPAKPNVKGYLLQLGAFKKPSEAHSLRAELLLNNYLNTHIESITHNHQRWHRVQIGPFSHRAQAKQAQAKLKRFNPVIKAITG